MFNSMFPKPPIDYLASQKSDDLLETIKDLLGELEYVHEQIKSASKSDQLLLISESKRIAKKISKALTSFNNIDLYCIKNNLHHASKT